LFTNALVLRIAYLDKDFVICTNVYKEGLGGILMQEGQVVGYVSRELNGHEVNYVTRDLELDAIIHALKMWRHYLIDKKFTLMTSHGGLKYLFDQPKLNARQARWLATLSKFDFEIWYIKGQRKQGC